MFSLTPQSMEIQNSPIMSPTSSPICERRKTTADHMGTHLNIPPVPPRLDLIRSPAPSPTGSPKVCFTFLIKIPHFPEFPFSTSLLCSPHQACPENRTSRFPLPHHHLETPLRHLLQNALLICLKKVGHPGSPAPRPAYPETRGHPRKPGVPKTPPLCQTAGPLLQIAPRNSPTLPLHTSTGDPSAAPVQTWG